MTPPLSGCSGLAAIIGAVTSSFSVVDPLGRLDVQLERLQRLLRPPLSVARLKRVIRGSIVLLGAAARSLALSAQRAGLWFFTSDLVFVLLFPQLCQALFDPRRTAGSVAAFGVSLVLRLGGGEPLSACRRSSPIRSSLPNLPIDPAGWYDAARRAPVPFKTPPARRAWSCSR